MLRGTNTWVNTANTDDDTNSAELVTATTKGETLVTKQGLTVTFRKTWWDRVARLQGIRDRLKAVRAQLQANREARAQWTFRVTKARKWWTFLTKKRSVIIARLRRLRLRKKRAIEARENAFNNEETTDEETFTAVAREEESATNAVVEAEKEEVVAAAAEAAQEALVEIAITEETEGIALIDAIELEDGLVEEEAEGVTEEIEQAALLVTDEAAYKTAQAEELVAQKESENATIAMETAKIGRITDLLFVELTEKRGALSRE